MSTSSITPDASQVDPSALSASAQAPARQAAQAFQDNTSAPSPQSGGVASGPDDGADSAPTSRLGAILGAVARTVSTGLSGIPAGGRPSFIGGLGQGARAEQAAQAVQSEIKFKDFDTQLRLANLHNQDKELQLRTQEQQDAHQKAQNAQADYDEDHGISYDPHPNDGAAVMDTLKGQTQANGAAEVPAGTHLSADGKTVNVPDQSQETQAGLLQKYKQLQGPLSLPALPQNAQFVPARALDVMTHKLGGYKADGSPWNHDDLPQQISSLQSQRDALTKSGANPFQVATINNTIGIMQAQSDALDKHAATFEQQKAQSKKAGEIAADMSPAGRALAQSNEKLAEQKQDNAASDRPTKPTNTDWNPGVGADEKKKAELAENIAFNANEVAQIVMKRPDILGAVAGRYTNAEQMIGNNDPDISALGVHVHNMAMANSGVHGFRSQEGVESYERQLLNNFKNGPAAMAGALRASTGSVQTFIDNARPQTYKTHTKQGGAVRGMLGGQ
jgi:hypothetical protein